MDHVFSLLNVNILIQVPLDAISGALGSRSIDLIEILVWNKVSADMNPSRKKLGFKITRVVIIFDKPVMKN